MISINLLYIIESTLFITATLNEVMFEGIDQLSTGLKYFKSRCKHRYNTLQILNVFLEWNLSKCVSEIYLSSSDILSKYSNFFTLMLF